MTRLLSIACLVALIGTIAAADDPNGRDEESRWLSHWGAARPELDDEQWDRIEQFMRENAPNALQRMEEGHGFTRNRLIDRYFLLNRLEDHDPELHRIKLAQLRAEDACYGLARQIRSLLRIENVESSVALPELERELREKVAELVQINFAERQHRIERLRRALAREEQRLQEDQTNQDEIVEQQFHEWRDGTSRRQFRSPDGPPRRGPRGE